MRQCKKGKVFQEKKKAGLKAWKQGMSVKTAQKRPPRSLSFIKVRRTLQHWAESTFSEIRKLINGLQQYGEHLFKKNNRILVRREN